MDSRAEGVALGRTAPETPPVRPLAGGERPAADTALSPAQAGAIGESGIT
jgi:hypothetical protein